MERDIAIKKIAAQFAIPEEAIISFLANSENNKAKPSPNGKTMTKPVRPILIKPEEINSAINHHVKKKYFFLEEDYFIFLEKMKNVANEIQRLGDEVGESCAESESYHDNFCYEEGGRQQRLWKDHLKYLQNIKENAKIIKQRTIDGRVNIGSLIELKTESGNIIKKRIGSFMTFSDDDLSYNSPLAQALIGKTVNSKIRKEINNEIVYYQIMKIE